MSDHDRFEILAGAVMLGEASESERATFAEHAATCDACAADAYSAPLLVRTIDIAKTAETWRPSVSAGITRRIRASRTSRFGATVGVLGWAVALSIVLNVAFVSGLSTRVHDAFEPAPDAAPYVGSMKIDLESPAPKVAAVTTPRHRHATVAWVARPKPHAHAESAAVTPAAAGVTAAPGGVTVPAPSIDDVPDVLAGLDVDGSAAGGAKHVAVQPRCPAPDPEATDASPVPCTPEQELQH